jgi:hypothetical protein
MTSANSLPTLTTVASWVIFGGGALVLVGSYRQAKAELKESWHKLNDQEDDPSKKSPGRLTRWVLESGESNTALQGLWTFLAAGLSFAQFKLDSPEGKKAMNSATAWGLILLGSVFATVAAAYQSVVLTFPNIRI